MKKIILSFLGICAVVFTYGQVAVTGVSPASVQGNYNFTVCETTSGWGLTMDFSVPGTYVQGELVMVEDGTPGTNAQGKPISQEGCSTLTNAASVNGKIAVVYRNTCEFGAKAKKAQDAGAIAVIILNRDNEVIAMGGGTDGPNVTIPVVMLSSIDGQLLTSEMANGPVVMFIGNKAGLSANDLAFTEELILTPLYNGVHSLLAQDGSEFNVQLGMRVYNYGTSNETNAKAVANITGPAGSIVFTDTVTFSLNGVTGLAVDSVDIFPNEALEFQVFSLSSYPVGQYTLEYKLLTGDGSADNFPNDNHYSIPFVVNNQMISKARLDATTLKPIATSYTSPAEQTTPYSEIKYCVYFEDANASRVAAKGLYTSISIDTSKANVEFLSGRTLFAEVFKWNDANTYSTPTFDNLETVASSEYNFENDVVTEDIYMPFTSTLYLEDNQKYLFCLINYGEPFLIGYDREVDFNATSQIYEQAINPLFIEPGQSNQNWFLNGFGPDLTPAVAIYAVDQAIAKVDEIQSMTASVYPNPANDVVTIALPLDGKATVNVNDLTGRVVSSHAVNFVSQHTSVSVADLQPGVYVFNVTYENGAKSTFNVVKK
ncbi:MAG: T9SS type A sorting domain-containing protein [Crocinitomicaceae bacterium]|nr:T9SS type A sorting domain-containing protein [Crocinitomicaceae bacterium]